MKTSIDIGKDFTRFPSGRYAKYGSTSGEAFRSRFLEPAFSSAAQEIEVRLDGTVGYGSSFLDEAFGGLVRLGKWPLSEIQHRLKLITKEQSLKLEIDEYLTAHQLDHA
jgi:hypothetical protein